MKVKLVGDFPQSGYDVNIVRDSQFDIKKTVKIDTKEKELYHNTGQVYISDYENSDSWAIVAADCLGSLVDKDLDYKSLISCYEPSQKSRYIKQGLKGDSVYSALYYMYVNGIPENNSYRMEDNEGRLVCNNRNLVGDGKLYKVGENEKMIGNQPLIQNVSPILNSYVRNELVLPNLKQVSVEEARNTIKHYLKKSPLIAGFIVTSDFNPQSEIYISQSATIVGFHYALVVGWGESEGIPYWIMKNSRGPGWGDKGYWRHAMYPYNQISCPDVSIHGSLLENVPERLAPLGGMIRVKAAPEGNEYFDTKYIVDTGYVNYQEDYPTYMWILIYLCFIVLFIEFFIT